MDLHCTWIFGTARFSLTTFRPDGGGRMTYLSGLDDLIGLKKQYPQYEMILYSDQGFAYVFKVLDELLPMYSITRSMLRAGTPTDNAAMESINGWIKSEIFMDFHVTGESPVEQEVAAYITFFNTARPAYSLKYLTLQQYKEAYAPKDFAPSASSVS